MAMVKKSITVTDQQEAWIQAQLADGQYASESEVFRNLIRREQAKNAEIEAIRAALIEAEARGISPLSANDVREDALKRLRAHGDV